MTYTRKQIVSIMLDSDIVSYMDKTTAEKTSDLLANRMASRLITGIVAIAECRKAARGDCSEPIDILTRR